MQRIEEPPMTKRKEPKVKTCPFCGSKPTAHRGGGAFAHELSIVACEAGKCPAHPRVYRTMDETADVRWNRRPR